MFGSEVLASRLSGIDTLRRLAQDYPEQMHVRIMELLCRFVRHRTIKEEDENDTQDNLTEDVQAITDIIRNRSETLIELERRDNFALDLRGAYLRDADLTRANLSSAELSNADLSKATLNSANLSDAQLIEANLSEALLFRTNLSNALLWRASLPGARLRSADLTGARLPSADLSNARLNEVDLSDARLTGANLSNARLDEANLSRARLWQVNLSNTSLLGADLSGAELINPNPRIRYPRPARNLTQAQLDEAYADHGDPPRLDGLVDPETNEPLVWRGAS